MLKDPSFDDFEQIKTNVLSDLDPVANSREQQEIQDFRALRKIQHAKIGHVDPFDSELWRTYSPRATARHLYSLLHVRTWISALAKATRPDVEWNTSLREELLEFLYYALDQINDPQNEPVAYHDETSAQRLLTLVSLIALLGDKLPEHLADTIRQEMSHLAQRLASDEHHSSGTNHGMFQDLALFTFAAALGDHDHKLTREYISTAHMRLVEYFLNAFTAEGVHIENTPTYHLMVSHQLKNYLKLIENTSLPKTQELKLVLTQGAKFATHAVMPYGTFLPISDTTIMPLNLTANHRLYQDPAFSYVISQGAQGRAPNETSLVLPTSGYAIDRTSWDPHNSQVAFFSAAYNANYHKHSDDLSLLVADQTGPILTEAGPFGYDYQLELTKYAYSQLAHNVLVVDGNSLPRTDNKFDDVSLSNNLPSRTGIDVTGVCTRWEDVRHERRVVTSRGSSGKMSVDVSDTITSPTQHSYELLWNVDPSLEVALHGQGFELFRQGEKILDLRFNASVATSIALLSATERGRRFGWSFPKFGEAQPAKVIRINFTGDNVKVHSKVRMDDYSYRDRGLVSAETTWKRFRGGTSLNYLEEVGGDPNSDHLIVAFSAIGQIGDFTYNYHRTLQDSSAHRLYILDDFGDQGSYYALDHRSTNILDSVQELISKVAQERGISPENVTFIGSSKGGSAAVIHGVTWGAGTVIAAAPQFKIGTFLAQPHPNILEYMAGSKSDSSVAFLDGFVGQLIENAPKLPRFEILCGDRDHHFFGHVTPMVKLLRESGAEVALHKILGADHAKVTVPYRVYLKGFVDRLAGVTKVDLPLYSIQFDSKTSEVVFESRTQQDLQVSLRLYRELEEVARTQYSDARQVRIPVERNGKYRARVFLRLDPQSAPYPFTTEFISVYGL